MQQFLKNYMGKDSMTDNTPPHQPPAGPIKSFFVRLKQYYTRGNTWFNYVFQFGVITANAKLFEAFFQDTFGLDVFHVVIIGVIGYTIISISAGGIDYNRGIWRAENDWVWLSTPSARKMSERVARIEEAVERIEKAICSGRDDMK
jgi:hypothetical protein